MKKRLLLLITTILLGAESNAQLTDIWDSVGKGVNGNGYCVKALALNDTNGSIIYAGGSFFTAGGKVSNNIAKWTGSGCQTCGNNNGIWSPIAKGVNKEVTALTMYKHKLVAGGAFDSAGGIGANYIASYDTVHSWDSLSSGLNGQVYALAAYDSVLYVGGSFTNAGGKTVNKIAEWIINGWQPIAGFDSGTVYCLAMYKDTLYAGGSFTSSGGNPVNYIAKWNGVVWLPVGGGMNNTVYTLTVFQNSLYAGGAFTNAGGVSANYVAQWGGSSWFSLGSGTNDTVRTMVNSGFTYGVIEKQNAGNFAQTALVVGGSFTMAGIKSAPYIALYFPNGAGGQYNPGWNTIAGLTKPVYAITSNQANNYVGGLFDSITSGYWTNAGQVNYIAQFTFMVGGSINELYNNSNVSVFLILRMV